MKNSRLFKTLLSALLLLNVAPAPGADSAQRGTIVGGVAHEVPGWFKESFLEIAEDVDEAAEENRHVLLFFQLT